MDFPGWFEREEQWVVAACIRAGVHCSRTERDQMSIGEAIIDLTQLQRALNHRPADMAESTVNAWVARAISAQHDTPAPLPIARILPHLRPPIGEHLLPWHAPLASGRLLECLVADEDETIQYLGPLQVVQFGLGVEGLRARARLNLSLLPPYDLSGFTPHEVHPDVWVCATGDGHDAARMLLADQLAGGPVIAWVPHRDRLVLTRREAHQLDGIAWAIREEAIRSAPLVTHPITAEAFLVNEGLISHLHFVGQGDTGRLESPSD